MTGPIIGDLAAWTYLHQPEVFFQHLTSRNAQLSPLGRRYLALETMAIDGQFHSPADPHEAQFSPHVISARHMMRAIVVGFRFDSAWEIDRHLGTCTGLYEKEDWYATHFLANIILALRTTHSIERALEVEHVGAWRTFTESHWQEGEGSLSYLVRAWEIFLTGNDFRSCVLHAPHLTGDTHLNFMLVAALAEAYYSR